MHKSAKLTNKSMKKQIFIGLFSLIFALTFLEERAFAQSLLSSSRSQRTLRRSRINVSNPRYRFKNGIVRTSTSAARDFNPFKNQNSKAALNYDKTAYEQKLAKYKLDKAKWEFEVEKIEFEAMKERYKERRKRLEKEREEALALAKERESSSKVGSSGTGTRKKPRTLSDMIVDKIFGRK